MTFLAFFHSLFALIAVWGRPPQSIAFNWLNAADLSISLDVQISAVNIGALLLITSLNLAAQVYAIAYLRNGLGLGKILFSRRSL
jgi:NAD(P)H-quinone oxidoreductase subunit 5